MATTLAPVFKARGKLRLLREEIALSIAGNLCIDAFGVTILTAQNPFRLICHSPNLQI
jgi:hypothetical protein